VSDLWKRVENNDRGYGTSNQSMSAYRTLLGIYALAFSSFAAAVATGKLRLPKNVSVQDLVLVSIATQKLSRLIAPLRAAFVHYEGNGDLPGEVNEVPRGDAMTKAIGELVTCPNCLAPTIATVGLLGLVLAPKPTRFVASIFAVAAASSWLNAAYVKLRA
jgi:hypothetical protein